MSKMADWALEIEENSEEPVKYGYCPEHKYSEDGDFLYYRLSRNCYKCDIHGKIAKLVPCEPIHAPIGCIGQKPDYSGMTEYDIKLELEAGE